MDLQAILFMCNDADRAFFVLTNFCKHNPDVPVRVINSGGDDPSEKLQEISAQLEFVNAPNLWHTKTHCGRGGFGPKYAEYLFDYGLNEDFSHTLYLETDVFCRKKVVKAPLHDISGPLIMCNPIENALYEHLGITPTIGHTGMGATAFSHKYFHDIHSNPEHYGLFSSLYESHPQHYYMDLVLTLVARYAGLSFGGWEEAQHGRHVDAATGASLVHGIKI